MKHDVATLEKIIRDADREKCVEFLLSCSEKERDEMWPTVKGLIPWVLEEDRASTKAMIHSKPGGSVSDRKKTIERCKVLGLAVLATGLFPDMRKLPWGCDPFDQPGILVRLLRGVDCPWLCSWVDFLAEERRHSNYECLIKAGFCKPPNDDNYILGFWGFGRHSRVESSRIDENFLNFVVWKFFELEGDGERSLANADKYCGKEEYTWAYALKKLSEEGKLSLSRLLTASLEALARDFPQYRAGWHSRFHEYLDPTTEDRIERADHYLKLLSSSIPPTVSFALKALKIIYEAGRLPTADLLQNMPPVLLAKSKGTVLAGLSLLETIAAQEPKQRTAVLKVAIEGLISEIIQVQERIVKLLTKYSVDIDDETRKRLTELAEMLSPSSRKKIAALLPEIKSSQRGTAIPDADGDASMPISPLDPSRQIAPIANVDELIEKASYLLENPDDLMEAERVFEGLVRLSLADRPELQKLGQPLLKRAIKLQEKNGDSPEQEPISLAFLALLVRAWLQHDQAAKTSFLQPIENQLRATEYLVSRERQHVLKFPFQRLAGILELIARRQHTPLLSTPTHLGFWIDPRILVDRLAQWQKEKAETDSYDLVVAFLRLGNEHRKVALKSARGLSGDLGAALRYALGADEKIGKETSLWGSASRARFSGTDDPELEKVFPTLGPGAAKLPKITWKPKSWTRTYQEKTYTYYQLGFEMTPSAPPVIPLTQLPVLLYSEKYCFYESNDAKWPIIHSMPRWAYQTFLSYWPSWREAIYFNGLLCCGDHTTTFEVGDHGLFVLFNALGDPDEEFQPNARLLLNFGLSCPHADGRAAAINAFVSGINHGRLNPKLLGQSMLTVLTSGLIHPARIRKSLDEIVRVSPRHRRAVLDYLGELMRGDPAQATDNTVKLLELFHELLVEHDERVRDAEVLAYLKAFPGGGRASKLARQIAQLS